MISPFFFLFILIGLLFLGIVIVKYKYPSIFKKVAKMTVIGLIVVGGLVLPLLELDDEPFIPGDHVDVPAYDYWYAPPSSFGIKETKSVNWSHFKSLFNAHTDWILEYKRYSYSEWTEGNQYLTVDKTWNDTGGFWKINLTFTAPVDVYEARFTFACDLVVLDYVEKDGYEVWLNYSANETEVYNMMFNWSDLKQYEGMYFNKGVTDDLFWFRFGRQNIPAGTYVFDPTFGRATTGSGACPLYYETGGTHYVYSVGSWYECGGSGSLESMTFYFDTISDTHSYQCALYEHDADDDAGDLLAVSEIKEVADTEDDTWQTFNFSEPLYSLSASTKYFLLIRGTTSPLNNVYGDWETGQTEDLVRFYSDSSAPFDDPYTELQKLAGSAVSIYATYTTLKAPVISDEEPSNNSYNKSVGAITVNVTVTDDDGNQSVCDFYTSDDGTSWTWVQTNSSILNESISYDYTTTEYQTTYYWKVTVDDGTYNVSSIYNFETTPYRTNYFNDTFPTENWINTSCNTTFETGWENFTYGIGGSGVVFFDNPTGNDGTTWSDAGNWSDGGGDYEWIFDDDGTTSSYTGADSTALATTPGTDYIYTEASSRNNKHYYLDSDEFEGSNNISVDFYYHMYGSDMGTLSVQIWDGSSWDTIWTKSGQQHVSTSAAFTNAVAYSEDGDSHPYTGTTKIRFDGLTGGNYRSDMCITYFYINNSVSGYPDGYILSEPVYLPADNSWDKFYASVNDTNSCSFALIDPNDHNYNITSGLTGNGDDISSVTNTSVMIFGNFSGDSVNMASWNISWSSEAPAGNNVPTASNEAPTNNTDCVDYVAGGKTVSAVVYDNDGDSLNVTWWSNSSGSWKQFGVANSSVANNTNISMKNVNFTTDNTKYWWWMLIDDGEDGLANDSYSFTICENVSADEIQQWNITIRNNDTDYFVWLGSNCSAWNVSQQIDGFDEAGEYIGIWDADSWDVDNGSWERYNYEGGGVNFSINTFDVVQIKLSDSGTQTISMYENYDWNYTNSKTYTWTNNTSDKGYNYTGYMEIPNTGLSTINSSVTLQTGEFIGLWNRTHYKWIIYIADLGITDDYVECTDVIVSKVEDTEVWNT